MAYLDLLRKESMENTWESKVQLITKLLGTSFSGLFNIETQHEDRSV